MNFDFPDNIVIKQQVLSCTEGKNDLVEYKDEIHIAYGIDDKFAMPMGIAIISILENNKQENIVFHVLTESLCEENIQYLQQLVDRYQIMIVIHYLDTAVFEKLPSTEHFTKATYNRFLLTRVLKNTAKRVIYLDADILCYGPIGELKNLDFKGNIVAVVQDIGAVAKRQIDKLQLTHRRYFNAGFLYIDIEQWEKNCISEKALQFSFAHLGKLNWLDQDALNVVLNDKALFIEEKYDYIFDFGIKENYHIDKIPAGMVFVHYAGRYKPWHAWCMHPLQKDFLRYFSLSPWKHMQLAQPLNYKEMKKMARSFIIYGKTIDGIIWYIKYAYHKIRRVE